MFMIIFSLWSIVVRDDSGKVLVRQNVESDRQALTVAGEYMAKGYSVSIIKDGDDVRLNAFIEGSKNVVSSISAGPGIEVNTSDPTNPIVSIKSSCSTDQIIVWNGSDWVCQDKPTSGGTSSDRGYTQVTMMSSPTTTQITWDSALIHCTNLNEGGYTDWRLPTAHEYVYYCKTHPSDTHCKDDEVWYWLGTYGGRNWHQIAWIDGYSTYEVRDGYAGNVGNSQYQYARCIR